MSAKALYDRRKRALQMPEEDRSPPGQSPASGDANKSRTYDTYLCPEPHQEYPLPGHDGVDHSELIVDALQLAIREFSSRGQKRAAERLKLDLAREEMHRGNWMDAMHVLRPLWQSLSWREEGWWALMEEVGWALRDCAGHVGDAVSIVAVEWELLCNGRHLKCRRDSCLILQLTSFYSLHPEITPYLRPRSMSVGLG